MIKIIISLLLLASPLLSQQQLADIGTLHLVSGDSIVNCKVGYRTFGTLNQDKSNIIVFPTWFFGTSEFLGSQVGDNKPLDSSKYFIIAVDALGNGVSSSPSNYNHPFPEFTLEDAVNSQYLLLTKHLNINKVYALYGGSMGGMQVFHWVTLYPAFMEKAVAYVGSPKLSASDHLLWSAQLEALKANMSSGASLEHTIRTISLIMNYAAHTVEYRSRTVSVDSIDNYTETAYQNYKKRLIPGDYVSQLKAMLANNITKRFDNSFQKTAAAITTDLFIIVSSRDQMVNPSSSLELASYLKRPAHIIDNDCGHLAPGCDYENFVRIIKEFLN